MEEQKNCGEGLTISSLTMLSVGMGDKMACNERQQLNNDDILNSMMVGVAMGMNEEVGGTCMQWHKCEWYGQRAE